MPKADPTKDPEFQKVLRHFVATPHKPHKPNREVAAIEADAAAQPKKRGRPPSEKSGS